MNYLLEPFKKQHHKRRFMILRAHDRRYIGTLVLQKYENTVVSITKSPTSNITENGMKDITDDLIAGLPVPEKKVPQQAVQPEAAPATNHNGVTDHLVDSADIDYGFVEMHAGADMAEAREMQKNADMQNIDNSIQKLIDIANKKTSSDKIDGTELDNANAAMDAMMKGHGQGIISGSFKKEKVEGEDEHLGSPLEHPIGSQKDQ